MHREYLSFRDLIKMSVGGTVESEKRERRGRQCNGKVLLLNEMKMQQFSSQLSALPPHPPLPSCPSPSPFFTLLCIWSIFLLLLLLLLLQHLQLFVTKLSLNLVARKRKREGEQCREEVGRVLPRGR